MSTLQKLANLKVGEVGVVHDFTDDHIASKLLSMGVLPGKSVQLIRRTMIGGSLYIKVAEHSFAIRDEEAQNIVLLIGEEIAYE